MPTTTSPTVLIDQDELQARISALAHEIRHDLPSEQIHLICVLKGACTFMTDLSRAIDLNITLDYIAVSSYGAATKSSGEVKLVKDLDQGLEGRDLLVVEDIVDTGLTLNYLLKNLQARNPASLHVCALLLKDGQQKVEPPLRYVGFRIPDEFAVGYGLDVGEKYRNLPSICSYEGPNPA